MDPEIFKAYDIRGLYGEQIDADLAERIGRAFAHVLGRLSGKAPEELRVGLGRDMRLSAPELAARYREGMLAEGVHVLDAGMVGSELLYYLVGSRELDGGLMCTASHNPKAYTGVKLMRAGRWRCPATKASRTSAARSKRGRPGGQGERRRGAPRRGTVERVELQERVPAGGAEVHRRRAVERAGG